jgi:hypothetical protein
MSASLMIALPFSAARLVMIKQGAVAIVLASISASRFTAAPVIPTAKQDRTSAANFRAMVRRRRGRAGGE